MAEPPHVKMGMHNRPAIVSETDTGCNLLLQQTALETLLIFFWIIAHGITKVMLDDWSPQLYPPQKNYIYLIFNKEII